MMLFTDFGFVFTLENESGQEVTLARNAMGRLVPVALSCVGGVCVPYRLGKDEKPFRSFKEALKCLRKVRGDLDMLEKAIIFASEREADDESFRIMKEREERDKWDEFPF